MTGWRLIYNQFKNAAVQNLTDEPFLPVETVTSENKKSALQLIISMSRQKRKL